MPRKLKLNPKVQEAIVHALHVGATHEHACQYAGIDGATFYRWLQRGDTGQAPYAEFAEAVTKAEAQAAVGWLALIDAAARNGQWQAAAWKLERRYPKVWGRRPDEGAEAVQRHDIHVHIHSARERLEARLQHLSRRHQEDSDLDA